MAELAQEIGYDQDDPDIPEFGPAGDIGASVDRSMDQGGATGSNTLQMRNKVLDDLFSQREQLKLNTSERQNILQQQEAAQAPLRQQATEALGARTAAAENLAAQPIPNLPAPPKLQNFLNRDVGMMMAGIGTLIAGFNANGRVRGIRANQSLAAGINGYMTGNLQVAKLGLEDWKNQVEHQLTEFKLIRQQNIDILNAKGLTIEQKMAEIQLAGAPYQNQMMQSMIEKQGIDGVIKVDHELAQIIAATERSLVKADPVMAALNIQGKQLDIKLKEATLAGKQAEANNANTMASLAGLSGEELLSRLPPGDAALIRKIANYELPITDRGGLDAKTRTRLAPLVAMYDPTYDATQYQARQAVKRAFASGKPADNIRSLNTAVGHLADLQKAGKDLNNSSLQLWNQIANYGLEKIGDPKITRFKTAATAVEGELATVFKGTAGTDQEIKQWRANINEAQSPAQIEAMVSEAVKLLGSRLNALQDQYKTGMGKPMDFTILSDKSRQTLKSMGIDAEALEGKAPSAPTPNAMPRARNPQTGETMIFKDGKWQKE